MKRRSKYHRRRIHHHIVNRCNHGDDRRANLLLMWEEKEKLFHELFGDRTLIQAAYLLYRVDRAKRRQRGNK